MKKQWWHEKVAYQIYPKSFCDSNGDGIGDIQGIISKLDYLKGLGIDIIWISPIYCSPFVDQGYDISDYYGIAPQFGTMDDMDELLAQAKKRDMYIVMDLVVNHCSDQHEWFQKALKDPDGKYGKYFYIKELENGQVPCNWRSYFGGSVWEPIPGTNKVYLHSFAKEQPDLNWENPEVREEIYKMMNWWLDKGLAGFRLDAIINIKKDLRFADLTPDRDDGMGHVERMLESAIGVEDLLMEMHHKTFEKHNAFSIAELFNYDHEKLEQYIGDNGCFSSIFDFDSAILGHSEKGWYDSKPVTPMQYRDSIMKSQMEAQDVGYMANIIENHDEPRGVSRYLPQEDCNDTSKKMLAMLTYFRRGLPFIYQGQEIGMENCEFESIDEIDDINTRDEYAVALKAGCSPEDALHLVNVQSRDNARTPFQWDDTAHAGFTTGTPWLMVNRKYKRINEKSQENDPASVLNFYKELGALRKNPEFKEAIVYGEVTPAFEAYENLFGFYRTTERQKLLVLANYQNKTLEIPFSEKINKVLINNYSSVAQKEAAIVLEPYQGIVLEV